VKGFRSFILRGNVVDLSVGVVIGSAFTALVKAFGDAFLNPLIGVFLGSHQTLGASFTVRGQKFTYGSFLTALVVFLITAAVVYFFVVVPMTELLRRFQPEPAPGEVTKVCPECLSKIPVKATRCAFCTVEQPVASGTAA
jgi:large conductance mechanosensitive channel